MQLSNVNLQGDAAEHALCQGDVYLHYCVAKGPARQEIGMVRKGLVLRAALEPYEQGQNVSIGFDFHPTICSL